MVCFFAAVSRRRLKSGILYAVLSGFLLGYAEGIRYTNIIMLIPPVVYGLLFLRKKRLWILGAFAGAVAVPYLFLCWFHWTSFGSPFATGYSLTNEQSGFALSYFWTNLRLYIPAVISDGTGLVTCLALIELVLLFGRNKRKAAVFLSWIIPLSLLYMFYYWAPTSNPSSFLRFILPVFVPMYILALSGLWNLIRKYSNGKQLFIILMLVIIHGIWGVCASFEDSEKYYIQQNGNKKVVDFALAKIPDGAVVFTDYGNLNTLDFEKKWVLYPLSILNQYLLKRRMQRSLENSISGLQKQRAELLKKRLLDLSSRDFHKTIMALIAERLKEGRRVYVLSSDRGINTFIARYKRYLGTAETAEFKEEIPFYRFYPTTRSSSRVDKAPKKKRVAVKQLIQVTAIRKKPLNLTASIKDLQMERGDIIRQLREENEAVLGDVYRLETIARQIYSLQRAKRAREAREAKKKRKK